MADGKHKFSEEKERLVINRIWDEYTTGKTNRQGEFSDFELAIDMMECKRTEKDYDWMSDVFIPEFPSIMLTEDSHDATQYFSTRDFVDVYLEGNSDKDNLTSKTAKKLINLCLNNKEIHHYQKYMQARGVNRLIGYVYAVCWWDQELKKVQTGVNKIPEAVMDEEGNPVMGENGPQYNVREEPVYETEVLVDRFNWMPLDPRNVFTDNKYCYSAQEEDGIVIRSEKTYWGLKTSEEKNHFINLDLLKDWKPKAETETSQESFNKDEKFAKTKNDTKFDILERYGRTWAVVKERDKYGYPTEVEPGIGDDGEPQQKAEHVLVRQALAYKGNEKVLIRFQAEPLRDGRNRPYIPVIKGICYIHATKKNGMSSAKYLRELQVASNDTMNLSNDRVKLATLPTFIGNKFMMEDNDTIFMEPEHTIEIDDVTQFKELKIRDNINGALAQYQMFKGVMQQVESVYPNTMGEPGKGSVTATAVAGADQRANVRNNYKSLTFEHTFLNEFYWMILQMAWQFMHPQTVMQAFTKEETMGFNPVGDYTYQPITSTVEVEYNKQRKVTNLDQIMGRIAPLAQGNPKIVPIIAHIIGMQLELLGQEYRSIEPMIKALAKTPMTPDAKGQGSTANAPGEMPTDMVSNQSGLPVSTLEVGARRNLQ